MTVPEAIAYLLDEFRLEEYVDVVRDDAREEDGFEGLSWDHPKVQRFQEACAALRASAKDVP
jgi:hypothetical protein